MGVNPALRAKFKEPRLWSRSYFVASVGGAALSVIKQCTQQQKRPLTSLAGVSTVRRFTSTQAGRLCLQAPCASPLWMEHYGAVR